MCPCVRALAILAQLFGMTGAGTQLSDMPNETDPIGWLNETANEATRMADSGAQLSDMADKLSRITADLAAMIERHEAEAGSVQRATQQLLLKVAEAVCDLDAQDERLQSVAVEHARQIAAIQTEMERASFIDDAPLAFVRSASGASLHLHGGDDCRRLGPPCATRVDTDEAAMPYHAPALTHLLHAIDPLIDWAVGTSKLLHLGTFGPRSLIASAALSFCIAALPRQPSG